MVSKPLFLAVVGTALLAYSAYAAPCSTTTCASGQDCCEVRSSGTSTNGVCFNTTTQFCSEDAHIVCPKASGNGGVCVFSDRNSDYSAPWGACVDTRYYECCDNGIARKNSETCCNDTACNTLNEVCMDADLLYREIDPITGWNQPYQSPSLYSSNPNNLISAGSTSIYRLVQYNRKVCTSQAYYGKTNGRLIFGAAVPLLFAIGAIIALLYAFILFFLVDSAKALNYLTLVWGVLDVLFSFLLIFSPIWHFGVLVALVVGAALAVGREPTTFSLRFVFVINFLMAFLLLNASFAIFGSGRGPIEYLRMYIAGAEKVGSWSSACPDWYLGLFQYDPSLRSAYLKNSSDDHWGICNKGWLQALVIFTCVFIDFHVLLVITLAARIQQITWLVDR